MLTNLCSNEYYLFESNECLLRIHTADHGSFTFSLKYKEFLYDDTGEYFGWIQIYRIRHSHVVGSYSPRQ